LKRECLAYQFHGLRRFKHVLTARREAVQESSGRIGVPSSVRTAQPRRRCCCPASGAQAMQQKMQVEREQLSPQCLAVYDDMLNRRRVVLNATRYR
jgi:predicted nucleic acid-binding Zn ribbon protein